MERTSKILLALAAWAVCSVLYVGLTGVEAQEQPTWPNRAAVEQAFKFRRAEVLIAVESAISELPPPHGERTLRRIYEALYPTISSDEIPAAPKEKLHGLRNYLRKIGWDLTAVSLDSAGKIYRIYVGPLPGPAPGGP